MPHPIKAIRAWVAPRALLAEATVYLLAARVALSILSFQQLTKWFVRPAKPPELIGEERAIARQEVSRAIFQVRSKSIIRSTCMHRAIAAQAMLRRRRVSTTLYYGARNSVDQGLLTHVWLQDGAQGVVGHFSARGYHVLERFPQAHDNHNTVRRAL